MTKEQDQKIVAAKQALVSMIGNFISRTQASVMADILRGEERLDMAERILAIWERIKAMPQSYGNEGKPSSEIMCELHYFHRGGDVWLTEKDMGQAQEWTPVTPQQQAYGLCDLGEPELGYVSLEELFACGFELDLYWTPKSLKDVQTERRNRGYN